MRREEMEWRVEKREGGAFARAVERPAASDRVTPLDVRRRQRPQGTGDFRDAQIREMTRLELRDPFVESHAQMEFEHMECVILIGLPASGKSTFFRERFAGTHDHISKDLLGNNRRPQRRQEQLISESLASGRSVVVDNTNPSVAVRAPLIDVARKKGAEVVGYFFLTEAADALRRNRARDGRERVPDVAIFTARKRLEPPTAAEGFERLFAVRMNEVERTFEVEPFGGVRL